VSWSDGGPATHDISTPATNTSYVATFRDVTPGCSAAPGAPGNLAGTVAPSSVTLTWSAPTSGDPPASYVVEAGMSPGATAGTRDTGSTATTATFAVPPGQYYVRVRATNECGLSGASNEIALTVP
jgi:hypothetical protein